MTVADKYIDLMLRFTTRSKSSLCDLERRLEMKLVGDLRSISDIYLIHICSARVIDHDIKPTMQVNRLLQ